MCKILCSKHVELPVESITHCVYVLLPPPPPQDHIDIGTSSRQSHLHGVAFPIEADALEAISDIKTGRLQYVQLVSSGWLSLSLALFVSVCVCVSETLLLLCPLKSALCACVCVCVVWPQSVDVSSEQILLARTEHSVAPNDLSKCFPQKTPRYHFYMFKHTHEGDYRESIGGCSMLIVGIYSGEIHLKLLPACTTFMRTKVVESLKTYSVSECEDPH